MRIITLFLFTFQPVLSGLNLQSSPRPLPSLYRQINPTAQFLDISSRKNQLDTGVNATEIIRIRLNTLEQNTFIPRSIHVEIQLHESSIFLALEEVIKIRGSRKKVRGGYVESRGAWNGIYAHTRAGLNVAYQLHDGMLKSYAASFDATPGVGFNATFVYSERVLDMLVVHACGYESVCLVLGLGSAARREPVTEEQKPSVYVVCGEAEVGMNVACLFDAKGSMTFGQF